MAQEKRRFEKLIRACRKGNRQAEESLYRRFYSFAMSIALRYARSREEAAEIVNDGFLKAFRNLDAYDTEKPFEHWFYTIMVRTAIDAYRKYKHANEFLSIDEAHEPALDEELYQKLQFDEVMQLLGSLPEMLRLIFNLAEIEGYTHKEIARELQIAENVSRAHLSRAKKMLRIAYCKLNRSTYAKVI